MFTKEELKAGGWKFYYTGKEYVAEHSGRKRRCISNNEFALLRLVNETYRSGTESANPQ